MSFQENTMAYDEMTVRKKMTRILQRLATCDASSYEVPNGHVVVKLGTREVIYSYAMHRLIGLDAQREDGNTVVFKGLDRSDEASAAKWLQEGLVDGVMDS